MTSPDYESASSRLAGLQEKLRELDEQRKAVIEEIAGIRVAEAAQPVLIGTVAARTVPSTPDEKVQLFLSLFRCRESAYPRLWESRSKGSKGYSPVCRNEWVPQFCQKPRIRCFVCANQAFASLDAEAVTGHLRGHHTIGTYAIREDDTCTFLAADFDGDGWLRQSLSFLKLSQDLDAVGIQYAILAYATQSGIRFKVCCVWRMRAGAFPWIIGG